MSSDKSSRGRVGVRILLPNGASLDEADIALIEAIARYGSILGTSRQIGVSYRKTWQMVDALNRAFEETVIETFTTGASVTDFGHRLVALFYSIERRSNAGAAAAIGELSAALDWTFAEQGSGGARAAKQA